MLHWVQPEKVFPLLRKRGCHTIKPPLSAVPQDLLFNHSMGMTG